MITYQVYAHQFYNRFLVTDVKVRRMEGFNDAIRVVIEKLEGAASPDLNILARTNNKTLMYV